MTKKRSLNHIWAEVRYNYDRGAYTREEMQTFARLSRDPELIREAAMSVTEFYQYVISEGGEWPAPYGGLYVVNPGE